MKTLITLAALALGLAAGASGAGSAASAPAFDAHWVKASAQGDIYEIAVGKLALQKGSGQACTIGQMLVKDHGKSLQQVQTLAKRLKITIPKQLNPVQQAIVRILSRTTGTGFQQLFAQFGVGDHQLDVMEARETATKAQTTPVKALARQSLPVLRKHLTQFVSLAKTTSTTTGNSTTTNPTSTTPASTTSTTTGQTSTTPTSTNGGSNGSTSQGCDRAATSGSTTR